MKSVSLISLGCAKNLVDSEIMAGYIHRAGMRLLPDSRAAEADAVIINTCGFIDPAKQESINRILEVARDRSPHKHNKQPKLIVAGCLAQRYSKTLGKSLPEVDAYIGLDQVPQIVDILQILFDNASSSTHPRDLVTPRSTWIPDYTTPRYNLTTNHSVYLKIAEGCNHPCAFCAIPQIRGRFRSRPLEDIVKEAEQHLQSGAKEINLIAQDTTYYGMDTWEQRPKPNTPLDSSRGTTLSTLIRRLNDLPGEFWIRILYTHPSHWSDELIQTIAECRKVTRYVDIPLQHISDSMLKKMRRETDSQYIRDLLQRIRAGIPGITLRTTFIVGFPGETQADIDELADFIRETRFERLGVFQYSREEGTRSAKFPNQVHHKTRAARWNRLMALQKGIAEEIARKQIGKTMKVLIDEAGIARGEADAPDVDTRVYLPKKLKPGQFVKVRISGAAEYDLRALPV